jgi:hypothetical protein
MAALAYLFDASSGEHAPPRGRQVSHLRLVGFPDHPREAPRRRPHGARRRLGWRRLLPGLATLLALGGLWVGTGALAALGTEMSPAAVKGLEKVDGGYAYVVKPGDSLWSIATKLEPAGDPRPLVDRLIAQLHGASLQPGEVVVVP